MPAYVLQTGLYAYARRRYCVYEAGVECRQQRGWRDSRQATTANRQRAKGARWMVNGERCSLLASVSSFGGSPGVYLLPVWFVCLPAIQVAQLLHLNLPRPSPSCLGQSASLLCPGSRSNFSIKSFCPLSLHSSASFQTVCECVCVCEFVKRCLHLGIVIV